MSIQFKVFAAFLGAGLAAVGSASVAVAGVLPPIAVSEPMSLAIYGVGFGALYLIKKLRG